MSKISKVLFFIGMVLIVLGLHYLVLFFDLYNEYYILLDSNLKHLIRIALGSVICFSLGISLAVGSFYDWDFNRKIFTREN